VIARLRRVRGADDGFSLAELMISMSVMGVVTIISASGFLGMFKTTNLTEAASLTQTSALASFSKLERDLRYASRINPPYQRLTGDFAVDYVLSDDAGVLQCVRLTLPTAGGALVRLQWPQSGSPAGVSAATVALDMRSANGSSTPFIRIPGGTANSNFDRLEVRLKSSVGVAGTGATRAFDLRFTALNTAPATTTLTCSQA
jgi:prepilin-type N-terminal cleavage/methylation domain-containing protein